MKNSLFHENKWSKFSEFVVYAFLLQTTYLHSQKAVVKPVYSLIILLGFILFLIAKISIFKKGVLFSFGCEGMTSIMKTFYFIGYALMIIGYFATFSIIT